MDGSIGANGAGGPPGGPGATPASYSAPVQSGVRDPSKDAIVVCVYGPSKYGKSTALIYAAPCAKLAAQEGALRPSLRVVGHTPKNVVINTIPQATKIIRETDPREADVVALDDLSLLADNTVSKYVGAGKTGYDLWGAMRESLIGLRRAAREAGIHVILNAHEGAPRDFRGAPLRGGPKLPGSMAEDLPAACDVVLRAVYEPGRKGWPVCYRCTPSDTNYISGDRNGVTPDKAPMNLREILRLAGINLRRAPGREWMDDAVVWASGFLLANAAEQEPAILNHVVGVLRSKGIGDLDIRWVIRDSLDRAVLTRAMSNPLAAFGVTL